MRISVKNVSKSYNGEKVLKNVSFDVEQGEFLAIMGKSGSGKSTLLNIIGGFLSPDEGEALWNDENPINFSNNELANKRCSDIGFVFQSFGLISTLTARENAILPLSLAKKLNEESIKYLNFLAKRLEVEGFLDKYPNQLSGGQCQRVSILRALAYKPNVIILDEPTGALDTVTEEKVMELLLEINDNLKTTIILVTHSNKVASHARKVILIKDGQIDK